MYGIFTYIWVIFRAHVGKYSIHGAYGNPSKETYMNLSTPLAGRPHERLGSQRFSAEPTKSFAPRLVFGEADQWW